MKIFPVLRKLWRKRHYFAYLQHTVGIDLQAVIMGRIIMDTLLKGHTTEGNLLNNGTQGTPPSRGRG